MKLYLQYLFARPFSLRALLCRFREHPYGVIWYNANGIEPDYRCKNCDDWLG